MSKNIIKNFIRNNLLTYIVGLFFMLTSSYVQALFPKVLGNTIDILRNPLFNHHKIIVNIFYILFIAFGTFISTYIWRNLVIGNGRKLECTLRENLFDHFQKLSPEFYNKRKTGDLIAYAINDITAVRMTIGPATAMAINGVVLCIASIYSMAQAINWKLTLLSLLPLPFVVFFMLKIGRTVQKRFRRVQESFASISDRVQENIYGIRVIKAYVQEEDEVKNFEELNNQMMNSNLDMVRVSAVLQPVIEICFTVSFVVNLIIGGKMVLRGSISLGDFIAFNTYLTMIMAPVISIGRVINVFQRGMASYKRLNEIFSVEPQIKDGKKIMRKTMQGKIEIKDLSFSYPGTDEQVLENISLTIPVGHTLGIVGKTGSGKSTLVNLLLRMYNTEPDTIFIDDTDINDYPLETLRNCFGYVPQETFLFSATIGDNIKFFKDIYSEEDIKKVSEISCISETINSFPQGFNTVLGERGVNLSGGQKQRISIARALIKDPPVLILDDALSAVDSITEARILNNLKSVRIGRTSVIIAHRLSAVEDADEIIVLDHGRISERGTHHELLKKGGLYYEIYKEQFRDKGNTEYEAS